MNFSFKNKRNQRLLGGAIVGVGLLLLFNIVNSDVNPQEMLNGSNLRGNGIKIGIVLSEGGKGDKSFNDSAIAGLDRAVNELGITYKDIEIQDNSQNITALEYLAKDKCDLVIGVGYLIRDALKLVSSQYPDTNFALVDSDYGDDTPANVQGMTFKDNEGSYLAGILAGSLSKSKVVGFIGGMETPLIQRFEGGYTAGVKAAGASVKLLSNYVATDGTGFSNLDRGREISFDFISKGADVIYHVSGSTGQGVFDAAASKGIKAIGVDSNQNWVKPGTIVASVLKRVDTAVFEACESVVDGEFQGGITRVFGLADDGVGITDLYELTEEETEGILAADQLKIKEMKDAIPEEVKQKVEQARQDIISGKIIVPDWMTDGKPKK